MYRVARISANKWCFFYTSNRLKIFLLIHFSPENVALGWGGKIYQRSVIKKKFLHLLPSGSLIIGGSRVEHDTPWQLALSPLVGLLQSLQALMAVGLASPSSSKRTENFDERVKVRRLWRRLFLICRRRQRLKSAPNLTIDNQAKKVV